MTHPISSSSYGSHNSYQASSTHSNSSTHKRSPHKSSDGGGRHGDFNSKFHKAMGHVMQSGGGDIGSGGISGAEEAPLAKDYNSSRSNRTNKAR